MDHKDQMKAWIALLAESESQQKESKQSLTETKAYTSTVEYRDPSGEYNIIYNYNLRSYIPVGLGDNAARIDRQKFETLEAAKQHAESCLSHTEDDLVAETLRARLNRFLSEDDLGYDDDLDESESEEDPSAKRHIQSQLERVRIGSQDALYFEDGTSVEISRGIAGTLLSKLKGMKPAARGDMAARLIASADSYTAALDEIMRSGSHYGVNEDAGAALAIALVTQPLLLTAIDRLGARLFSKRFNSRVLKLDQESGQFNTIWQSDIKADRITDPEGWMTGRRTTRVPDKDGRMQVIHKDNPAFFDRFKRKITSIDRSSGKAVKSKVTGTIRDVPLELDDQYHVAREESNNKNITLLLDNNGTVTLFYDGSMIEGWASVEKMKRYFDDLDDDRMKKTVTATGIMRKSSLGGIKESGAVFINESDAASLAALSAIEEIIYKETGDPLKFDTPVHIGRHKNARLVAKSLDGGRILEVYVDWDEKGKEHRYLLGSFYVSRESGEIESYHMD